MIGPGIIKSWKQNIRDFVRCDDAYQVRNLFRRKTSLKSQTFWVEMPIELLKTSLAASVVDQVDTDLEWWDTKSVLK